MSTVLTVSRTIAGLVRRGAELWLFFAAVLAFALHVRAAEAREVPALAARVNDTVGLLSPGTKARLEERLAAYESSTGKQFAVLIIDSLGGDSLEDFSIRTVEAWKLGKKKVDDGLLLLIVRDDRKVRVEVGYGLEGVVTDAVSARVIREQISPAFRRGDYDGGVEAALDRLMRVANDGQAPPPGSRAPAQQQRRARPGASIGLVLFLLFFVLPWLLPLFSRGRGRRRGYGASTIGGILGGLASHGSRSSSWGGGGGFGGGGGGGFGGGGFGGGGGGFGGGGASGSW